MHFLGYVIVDEPTNEAVEKEMNNYGGHELPGDKWDWYRIGGRWDGHLQGPEEEKRRETDDGFNFETTLTQESAAHNHIKISDLPPDHKPPYFFISPDDGWIAKEYYDQHQKNEEFGWYGKHVNTPDYEQRYRKALEDNKDKYIVCVDAHN